MVWTQDRKVDSDTNADTNRARRTIGPSLTLYSPNLVEAGDTIYTRGDPDRYLNSLTGDQTLPDPEELYAMLRIPP